MAQEKRPLAHELLSRAFAPEEAERIYVEKVKQKPLFLRPTEPDASNNRERRRRERARKLLQRKQKQKPKPLSAKEKRVLKIYDVPKEARKYKIYEPLHRMWVGYIQEVLGEGCLPVTPSMVVKLCSADFHGARIEVVRSRCVSRVGLKGIVVKDTKFTFEVVTIKDEVKVIPKEHSIFRFEVPPPGMTLDKETVDGTTKNLVFELHGSQFENRAVDRANKKFKQRNLPDL